MRAASALALIYVASVPGSAHAQTIRALVCEFTGRHTATLEPAYRRGTDDKLTFTFAALSTKNQKAQMVGNGGATDVVMYTQGNQLQFVEFSPSGNLTVTSVFLSGSPEGNFAAVHSRHIRMLDSAVVSQYTGMCSARQ